MAYSNQLHVQLNPSFAGRAGVGQAARANARDLDLTPADDVAGLVALFGAGPTAGAPRRKQIASIGAALWSGLVG